MQIYFLKVIKTTLYFAICFLVTVGNCYAQRVNAQLKNQQLRLQELQKTSNRIKDPSSSQKFSEAVRRMQKHKQESEKQQQQLTGRLPLNSKERSRLEEISRMISKFSFSRSHGLQVQIQQAWATFMTGLATGNRSIEVNPLVTCALHAAFMDASEELLQFATKLSYHLELENSIRAEIIGVRQTLAEWIRANPGPYETEAKPRTKTPWNIQKKLIPKFPNTKLIPDPAPDAKIATKKEIGDYIDGLERTLSSTSSNAQAAQVDLQKNLKKQERGLQSIRNISKMLTGTATKNLSRHGN